jgi:CRP-like cAMP-binding protein
MNQFKNNIMNDEFKMFNDFVKKYVKISEVELQDLNHKCRIVNFSKGDIIIKSGVTNYYFYFINKGFVKYYIDNEDGYSKVYNFRTENMTLAGYGPYNYKDNFKALMSVKCVEDCEMIQIPLEVLNYVVENYQLGERLGRYMAEAHVVELVNYIVDRDSKSVIEKYNELEQSFPNIHQRIPQYLIASYLGITAVHLSNLKKSRKG